MKNNISNIIFKMTEQKQWGWCGFELPDRPCSGTYQLYPYDTLSPVQIPEKYNITTLKQLEEFVNSNENDDLLYSPTGCYFSFSSSSGEPFFLDSQGCVMWVLKESGEVATTGNIYVAKSLPEFLTRIAQENRASIEHIRQLIAILRQDR
jgi:hypothetical protein